MGQGEAGGQGAGAEPWGACPPPCEDRGPGPHCAPCLGTSTPVLDLWEVPLGLRGSRPPLLTELPLGMNYTSPPTCSSLQMPGLEAMRGVIEDKNSRLVRGAGLGALSLLESPGKGPDGPGLGGGGRTRRPGALGAVGSALPGHLCPALCPVPSREPPPSSSGHPGCRVPVQSGFPHVQRASPSAPAPLGPWAVFVGSPGRHARS